MSKLYFILRKIIIIDNNISNYKYPAHRYYTCDLHGS